MRTHSYPWLDDRIVGSIAGFGLRRFQVSQIADRILKQPFVNEQLAALGLHSDPYAQFIEVLPDRIRQCIRRPCRLLHAPGKRKAIASRRIYQSYLWFGDSFYQHFDGMGPVEADLVLHRLTRNRQHVQKHEAIIALACMQMHSSGCLGSLVDWGAVAEDYLKQYPAGLPA